MDRYNVIWNSASRDASGQMPIGNGDIAAGVYAIKDGDLYLLLSKNDALTYQGDIFKTGRVQICLDPNPFTKGKSFHQILDISTGSILIEADGVKLRIWVDALRPVYHIEINAPYEIQVTARPKFWKRFDGCVFNCGVPASNDEPTQDVLLERGDSLIWYYHVGDRSVFKDDLKFYDVKFISDTFADPYRFNTFGNLLESPSLKLIDSALSSRGKSFDIRIHAHCKQESEINNWIEAIETQSKEPVKTDKDWLAHCSWWKNFWERSWIIASDNSLLPEQREVLSGEAVDGKRQETDGAALVAQSYNVFRFLMACQSRGRIQTKFNGGLFTQPLSIGSEDTNERTIVHQQKDGSSFTHEDDRLWGRRFTYQNQRLMYWPLLMSGDLELMQPFFNHYNDVLPVRKAITRVWFGHGGAYFRENIELTGAERDIDGVAKPPKRNPGEPATWYHDYYFTSGLETVTLMLEFVKFSENSTFCDEVLVPFAREVLQFFDKHYDLDETGKIRLDPSMVLETFWEAVNPAPDIAGLQYCLDELLAMNAGTKEDRDHWQFFRSEIPEVPLQIIDGRRAIAPAEKWNINKNWENGELYPVFPFRCFGLEPGTADIVEWTMKNRTWENAFNFSCWTQDQIHWAYAGNAHKAAQGLEKRFRVASNMCRFPLYGREIPDSCPDFDHFGSGSTALQRMLVQESNGKILLLPAWPAKWDVNFKLHLEKNTVISGEIIDGELKTWNIIPESRKKNVIICAIQS